MCQAVRAAARNIGTGVGSQKSLAAQDSCDQLTLHEVT